MSTWIAERVSEIVRSALYQAEQALLALIAAHVDPPVIARLLALIAVSDHDGDRIARRIARCRLSCLTAASGSTSMRSRAAG